MLTTYRVLLLVKLVGVVVFAGGLFASFLATSLPERKRAVHNVASPGLLLVWLSGYFLTTQIGIKLTELWILAALVLSFIAQGALVHSVSRDRRTVGVFLAAFVPLVLVLALMVFRPTWASVGR
jgi:hypothetical protein